MSPAEPALSLSNGDDWQLPGGNPRHFHLNKFGDLRIPSPLSQDHVPMTFSVVPTGLFSRARQPRTASWAKFIRPYGTRYKEGCFPTPSGCPISPYRAIYLA